MKRLKLLFALLIVCMTSMAQTKIQGTLKDSLTNETEPYATIRVFKAGNKEKPAAMALTKDNGEINLEINGTGKYTLNISSVGKKDVNRELNLQGQGTINLGTIYTSEAADELKGIEVIASKPIVKMETDKMTYSVKDDADAKAMTVLDMLRKVPMVTVDAQDNITVNGSSSFKVLIDGKPNVQMQSNAKTIFKVMPASAVEKIEVLTNPGARFDGEGVGGVLNITLVHDGGKNPQDMLNGYNGEISLGVGNRRNGASLYIGGQQGKFTYNFNGYAGKGINNDIEYSNENKQFSPAGTSTILNSSKLDQRTPFAGASLNMGFELDSMSTVSAAFGFNHFSMKQSSNPHTSLSGPNYGSGFSYDNSLETKEQSQGFSANADYQRFFNKERTSSLTVSYQFSTAPEYNKETTLYNNVKGINTFPLNNNFSDAQTKSTEHVAQLDYTTPLAKGHTLNAGAKFISHLNHSDSKFYNLMYNPSQLQEDLSVLYDNKQRILAGYAEYSGSMGKWSTRAGLRYEQTWENIEYINKPAENFKKNYGNFIPTATLSYNIAPTTNIGINYAMRILRPGISYLNPYRDTSNPTNTSYGNPNLNVEKSHSFNFVFNHYSARFMVNATLSQSFCNNQIAQFSFTDNKNILNTTYGNNVKNRWTNFNAWMRWTVSSTTSLMINGYVGYGDIRSKQLDARNHGWQTSGMFMLEQTLPGKIRMNLGVQASSKNYNIQGYNGGMSFAYTVLSKDFFKDKLTLSAFAMSPLTGMLTIHNYTRSNQFENNMNVNVPLRMFQIAVSWKFGNTKKNFKKQENKIQTDYGKQQSQGQQIGNVGAGKI